MKKSTYSFLIRIIITYVFFIFGCYILDDQDLFKVLFPHFNKAPESSYLFLIILFYLIGTYLYKLYRINKSSKSR